jgi:dTDP-4-amino-4,6-dideoxygalactose transaminase
MENKVISLNRPYLTGKEKYYLQEAYQKGQLAGNGYFTQKCQKLIEKMLGTKKAFLTHSCTAALEMAAILADIQSGDEIIMPSYTFVSTANAFVLRGGVPVFVDIRTDTLNIDEKLIEAAITPRTKAIVPVHYAGVGCEMSSILAIAKKYKLVVIEDAAHCVKAKYNNKELGTLGDFGALSFHETKNIISGEGGALLINNAKFIERAEIIWQKGTDRTRFFRGEVDKYSWKDIGSSFLPGELMGAFLWAQLEKVDDITQKRLRVWRRYHKAFNAIEEKQIAKRPKIPAKCSHNAHNYFLICKSKKQRIVLLKKLHQKKIGATFHYIPLHTSTFAKKNIKQSYNMTKTTKISNRIVRLPLYTKISKKDQEKVIKNVIQVLKSYEKKHI